MCVAPGGYEPFGSAQIFSLSPPDWNPFVLTNFVVPGGPVSAWVSTDASGNVYGTANDYGRHFMGNVFELTCCWNYSDLYDFVGPPNDGAFPNAPPVVDAEGNIYGTTSQGGTGTVCGGGCGVVWEISP
jgi:hypothetical protein